jgi:hypothetical protein
MSSTREEGKEEKEKEKIRERPSLSQGVTQQVWMGIRNVYF